MKSILFAIGGNSLISDSEHQTVEDQYAAVCQTTREISSIIEGDCRAVITHGNGPQVGFILRRSEIAEKVEKMHAVPLVSCGADTQGAIGFQIQQALDNDFARGRLDKKAVTVITQVEVDPDDPAFAKPAKPIGRFYSQQEHELISTHHPEWSMVEDSGRGYRRVVPSPLPGRIVELDAVAALLESGFTVIAAGGGGIPVSRDTGSNELVGVDAVIDKDRASALLAAELNIETFVISTAVANVAIGFNTPEQQDLGRISLEEVRQYLADGEFAPGSMAPKIEAAISFLEAGGSEVIITNPENLREACCNGAGTHITKH